MWCNCLELQQLISKEIERETYFLNVTFAVFLGHFLKTVLTYRLGGLTVNSYRVMVQLAWSLYLPSCGTHKCHRVPHFHCHSYCCHVILTDQRGLSSQGEICLAGQWRGQEFSSTFVTEGHGFLKEQEFKTSIWKCWFIFCVCDLRQNSLPDQCCTALQTWRSKASTPLISC